MSHSFGVFLYDLNQLFGIDSSNNKVYVGNSGRKSSGWFDLSTLVKARGFKNLKNMNGWLEIYK